MKRNNKDVDMVESYLDDVTLIVSAAACLIEEISSLSHPTQCEVSFSEKKSFPNCFAR
jgi:hypothetical protein